MSLFGHPVDVDSGSYRLRDCRNI